MGNDKFLEVRQDVHALRMALLGRSMMICIDKRDAEAGWLEACDPARIKRLLDELDRKHLGVLS